MGQKFIIKPFVAFINFWSILLKFHKKSDFLFYQIYIMLHFDGGQNLLSQLLTQNPACANDSNQNYTEGVIRFFTTCHNIIKI